MTNQIFLLVNVKVKVRTIYVIIIVHLRTIRMSQVQIIPVRQQLQPRRSLLGHHKPLPIIISIQHPTVLIRRRFSIVTIQQRRIRRLSTGRIIEMVKWIFFNRAICIHGQVKSFSMVGQMLINIIRTLKFSINCCVCVY